MLCDAAANDSDEQVLRENERRLRVAWDASSDAFFLYDSVRNARGRITDFRIIDANAAGVELANLPREKLIGSLLCEGFPFVRVEGFFAREVHVVETGEPLTQEFQLNAPGFAAKWIEKRVMKAGDGMVAVFRDVTGSRRDAETLQQSKRELIEAQRLGRIGSWFWEVQFDRVTWSEELYRIAGREPGRPPPSYAEHPRLYTADSWGRLNAAVVNCLKDGTPFDLELEMIRPDGEIRWTNGRGEAQRDRAGNVVLLRGTAQDITERKQAELALKALPRRILEAQETERRRVARDLHDGVGQLLISARYRLHALVLALPEARQPPATTAQELIGCALNEVRRISHGLRPSALDDLGLSPALQALGADFRVRTRIGLTLRCSGGDGRLPANIEEVIYRIVQEALTNIERHAAARQVALQVTRSSRGARVSIRDDGRGFAATKRSRGHARGLGLLHMRERAELAGGTFALTAGRGRGTAIVAEFPLLQNPPIHAR